MRLGNQAFVANAPANAGQEMYTALMAAGTPVPPTYMLVDAPSAPLQAAVPVTGAGNFHAVAGFANQVPIQEATFLAARRTFEERVNQQAICVHQRGYAVTDSSSKTPLLSTLSIAPCIVVVVHNPFTKMAALTHVDANMNTPSLANVVNEFAPGAPLDIYFHGGMTGVPESRTTCEGLLLALYQLEGGSQRFTVREFDVLDRPHGRELTFDTADATLRPGFAPDTIRFDSVFRTLTDGTYLVGDAVTMANVCEQMMTSNNPAIAAAGAAARDIRKQFDGRPDKIVNYLKTVEKAVFAAVAAAAVERTAVEPTKKGQVQAVQDAVTAVLRPASVLELVERNLQKYLGGGPVKTGDRSYLVEVLISALINGDDLQAATGIWLKSAH